jgi:hypothetical protein
MSSCPLGTELVYNSETNAEMKWNKWDSHRGCMCRWGRRCISWALGGEGR